MKLKYLFLLTPVFFVAVACSLLACKKDTEKNIKLDPAGLNYIQLRPGQYFIYKDSASGRLDSVVVAESSLSSAPYSTSPLGTTIEGNRQVFRLTLTQKSLSGDSVWLKGVAKAEPYLGHLVRLEKISGDYLFVYPASCLCTSLYKIPSLTIEGKTYSDVIVKNVYIPDYRLEYYWAPSVGIIKLIKYESLSPAPKTWTYTLLRHN